MLGGIHSRFTPPKQGVHPGEQLGERKGLHEIIVGSGFKALDPIADGRERREHQDRRVDLRGANGLQNRNSVQNRKHSVENDEVETSVRGAKQSVLAVRCLLDAMPFLRQAFRQIGRSLAIVFNEQDLAAHDGLRKLTVPRGAKRGESRGFRAARIAAVLSWSWWCRWSSWSTSSTSPSSSWRDAFSHDAWLCRDGAQRLYAPLPRS